MSGQKEYKAAMGQRIQKARKASRLTQMKFAEEIDVSHPICFGSGSGHRGRLCLYVSKNM